MEEKPQGIDSADFVFTFVTKQRFKAIANYIKEKSLEYFSKQYMERSFLVKAVRH